MHIDLSLIKELSLKEPKSILERFLKLSEECGELAEEILIERKASGFQHKSSTDGILGESVDVLLVAFSIFFKNGGSIEELNELIEKKAAKWQRYQKSS